MRLVACPDPWSNGGLQEPFVAAGLAGRMVVSIAMSEELFAASRHKMFREIANFVR